MILPNLGKDKKLLGQNDNLAEFDNLSFYGEDYFKNQDKKQQDIKDKISQLTKIKSEKKETK